MTPEELAVRYSPLTDRAQRILEALAPPMSGEERREVVVRHLMDAIKERVAEACEDCAKIADAEIENDEVYVAARIATAIRALA